MTHQGCEPKGCSCFAVTAKQPNHLAEGQIQREVSCSQGDQGCRIGLDVYFIPQKQADQLLDSQSIFQKDKCSTLAQFQVKGCMSGREAAPHASQPTMFTSHVQHSCFTIRSSFRSSGHYRLVKHFTPIEMYRKPVLRICCTGGEQASSQHRLQLRLVWSRALVAAAELSS
eukprot:1161215-Pelagomonas_calceolata.AAC.15